jgi:hypothetical protein
VLAENSKWHVPSLYELDDCPRLLHHLFHPRRLPLIFQQQIHRMNYTSLEINVGILVGYDVRRRLHR